MGMVKCKACKSKVSSKAKACPNCGHPVNKQNSASGCGCAILVVIAIFLYVLSNAPIPKVAENTKEKPLAKLVEETKASASKLIHRMPWSEEAENEQRRIANKEGQFVEVELPDGDETLKDLEAFKAKYHLMHATKDWEGFDEFVQAIRNYQHPGSAKVAMVSLLMLALEHNTNDKLNLAPDLAEIRDLELGFEKEYSQATQGEIRRYSK